MDNSICQVYEDEIQSLEEEIKLLAEKYEDSQQESTFFSDEEILMSMYAFFHVFHIYSVSLSKLFRISFCLYVRTSLMLFLQC